MSFASRVVAGLLALAGVAPAENERIGTLVRWYLDEASPSRREDFLEALERVSGDPARVAASIRAREHAEPDARPEPAAFDAQVALPAGYDPARAWPLVLELGATAVGPPADAIFVRMAVPPGETAVEDVESRVLSLLAHLHERLHVDPERVTLQGEFDFAGLALHVAAHHPDRFAGVLALQPRWAPDAALAPNAAGFSVLLVERRRPEPFVRAFYGALEGRGGPHLLLPRPAAGDTPLRPAIDEWRAGARRASSPARIELSLDRPGSVRSHWLRAAPLARSVQEMAVGPWEQRGMRRRASIVAEVVEPGLVKVKTENIAAFEIFLDASLFPPDRPLRVLIDDAAAPEARIWAPNIADLLEDYRDRRDPNLLYPARLTFSR